VQLAPLSADPISPELVLVDPELRRRLMDAPAHAFVPVPARAVPAPSPPPAPPRGHRSVRLLSLVVAACAGAAAAVAVDRLTPIAASVSTVLTTPAPATTVQTTTAPAPTPTLPSTPAGRDFAWTPATGAAGYEFQLWRNGVLVLSIRTHDARVHVPPKWRREGETIELEPGLYRWIVWPLQRRGDLFVRAQVVVNAQLQITG